jgi:hypothetical protein
LLFAGAWHYFLALAAQTPALAHLAGAWHYFLALAAQTPALAHLAGLGQPLQGLKGADFLPAGLAGAIIFLPYIMGISS